MSPEQNKSIVLRFYKSFDESQIDQALNLLSPNFTAHLGRVSTPLNKEEFKEFGMKFYLAFSQSQHRFDEVIVSGDKVVTCGIFTAIHTAEFQGLPATGKQVNLAIMHIDRLENGKIIEHWGYGDALGLMQQLGVMFLPSPTLFPAILKNLSFKFLKKFG
ncbi:ester cyclase [Gloeothece verrucosa]|uniref:Ester cyclase n=1 Tax=Gloeothece verrucosa (strain PCC 7822) TaxID=497965 RepID=E0UN07_GLOV7|nr:ester cyclase [Gloeothece verrucosa]ADN18337.1 protein of unknown function DUF1486 [Gloeothece verrucosa PCC 7822]